jgi:hypothetical protein
MIKTESNMIKTESNMTEETESTHEVISTNTSLPLTETEEVSFPDEKNI